MVIEGLIEVYDSVVEGNRQKAIFFRISGIVLFIIY
jgi:hypothetical protein